MAACHEPLIDARDFYSADSMGGWLGPAPSGIVNRILTGWRPANALNWLPPIETRMLTDLAATGGLPSETFKKDA